MSELMNTVSKDNIRSQMNLLFSMMRFLATILDLALDNQMACDTVSITAEGILKQATLLYRDVGTYVAALSDREGRTTDSDGRNAMVGDENEAHLQC